MRYFVRMLRTVVCVWIGVGVASNPLASESRMIGGPAGRLHVDVRGSGDLPVVLIPSLAGSTRQWEPQLAHLASNWRVIAIDLRGHGKSDSPVALSFQPGDYAEDVEAVLDALDIRKAVIVGHSMGSAVALAFASDHPSRVRGLVLVDPVDDPLKRPPDPAFETFLKDLEGVSYHTRIEEYWKEILVNAAPGVASLVLADLQATPQRTVVESMRALARFDSSRALTAFKGPVMSVTTPLNDFPSSLHRVHPGLPHHRLTNVSHWLQLDRPVEFNRILDGFLEKLR